MRGQTAKRARKAKTLDTRADEARGEEGRGARRASGRVRFRFPEPPHCGRDRARDATDLAKAYGGPTRVRGRHVRRRPRGAAADHGPERRGQDQPAADPHRADRGRRAARSGSATASCPATTRRSTRASATGSTCWHHMRAESAEPTTRRSGRSSACSACTGRWRSRTPARCRAARRRSSRSPSSSPGARTCSCSTSRRTTSTRRRGRRSPRRSQGWPGAMIIVSHDTEFVRGPRARSAS